MKKARFILPAALLLLALPCPSPAAAIPAASSYHVSASASAQSADAWEDILYYYLIWLYQVLGGNPSNMTPSRPVECMILTQDQYHKIGVPAGLTSAQRLEWQAHIQGAYTTVLNAPSSIPSSVIDGFLTTLEDMYIDVESVVEIPE